jgi:hypothetical protein
MRDEARTRPAARPSPGFRWCARHMLVPGPPSAAMAADRVTPLKPSSPFEHPSYLDSQNSAFVCHRDLTHRLNLRAQGL